MMTHNLRGIRYVEIIALASATGEKKKKKKKSPGQGGAEGPDAGSFYGGGGRRPPTTRANTGAPRKKFSTKVEKLASAIYTRLCKTQNSAI